MRVLWLVSITIPAAAAACGLAANEVGGGWLTGQLTALRALPGAPELTVCSVDARVQAPKTGAADGVRFRLLPAGDQAAFSALLREDRFDLVHIWGTEYPAARALHAAALAAGVPALVGIQGVMADCAAHLCDGVPEKYRRSCFVQRGIDRIVPGALLDGLQAHFDALAAGEAALLREARFVTGRTAFDKAAAARLAPRARYFVCNETLRPAFYKGPAWRPRTFGAAPRLLMSQGNYPLKNLHTVLQALPALRRRWPGLTLAVAGWPPLDKGPLLRPVIDWMFPYQRYCKRLIRTLGLEGCVRYTGPLDEAAMKQAYLDADLYLLPSSSENSPNSLGEAMLLGLPCVASAAGGIPDMLADGREGALYAPPGDAAALTGAVLRVLGAPDAGAALGAAAQARAQKTHDPAANARALAGIYTAILNGAEILNGEDTQ